MLKPFFDAAMQAPGRHRAFRQYAVTHVLAVIILGYVFASSPESQKKVSFAYFLLGLGLLEASAIVGWRLAQLPKSQALEFLLVSPVQPKRLFMAEALVGLSRFVLVWLSALPVFSAMLFAGWIVAEDLLPLFLFPLVWGAAISMALTAWVYEPAVVRRIGEVIGLLGVLVYLTVGVLAGENLVLWLQKLPPTVGQFLYDGVLFTHTMNPFGVVRYWFLADSVAWIAVERVQYLLLAGAGLAVAAGVRAAFRLQGHFHDRHYKPLSLADAHNRPSVGDDPLTWWAVKRVMEYSGRINLWLAGGFSVIYAGYLMAGDAWPPWMGKLVFQIFETWGGAATVATSLAVMAAVPAIFQFGLWDATVSSRCQRLELLLLTDLSGADYWRASLKAAWKRGRGYLFSAVLLWIALVIHGRVSPQAGLAAMLGGLGLWAFSFAVGFRSFATGQQTSGLASILTLGVPLILALLVKSGYHELAALLPAGLCHIPASYGLTYTWFLGMGWMGLVTYQLTRTGLARCETDLRAWYDANQGKKSQE